LYGTYPARGNRRRGAPERAGGSYYLTTANIWGHANIPAGPVGHGNALSATIEFSTTGMASEVFVFQNLRVRQLLGNPPLQGFENSRTSGRCLEVK